MHLRVSQKPLCRARLGLVALLIASCLGMLPGSVSIAEEDQIVSNSDTTASGEESYRRAVLPILEEYCFGCHADGADEGNFSLDEFPSVDAMIADTRLWWSVLKNVRSDVMPPDGEEQPSEAEKQLLFQWITTHVLSSARQQTDPGPSRLRRLNRMEYRNTIRDLMGIDFDTSVEFPPDDSGDGFDNNADALSISPLLAEKYIESAREIVDRAVPKNSRVIPVQVIDSKDFETEIDSKSRRLSFDTEARASTTVTISGEADYRLIVPIEIDGSFDFSSLRARVRLLFDGEVFHDQEYGWQSDFAYEVSIDRHLVTGDHSLELFVDPVEPTDAKLGTGGQEGTFVIVQIPTVRIEGPLDRSRWIKPDGYERFFHLDDVPVGAAARTRYATEVLRRFCRRAYRRPVDDSHVQRLLKVGGFLTRTGDFVAEVAVDTPSFEQRVGRAMTAVLASPRFLFRVEQPQADSAELFPEVDDYSLASRLSYFLWSTMPDDELRELADRDALKADLNGQLQRMLRDKRSDRLIENFVGQWLQTRDVESVSIDPLAALGVREEYERLRDYLESTPSGRGKPLDDASQEHRDAYQRYREIRELRNRLDGDVRRDMAEETERLFSHVLRDNRSLVELIDSDYAFLNERLAKHYGVPGVKGDRIQKVRLPADSPLGGVLTQGTFLLVTSNPTRTSPVKRGLFILDNILGTPAPPAPAMVPELEASADHSTVESPTLRQLLEIHRSEPLCRSCHARFDPLGLALENFTAIGTWRDDEKGQPIQPGGRLISGESFDNVTELKKILAGPRRSDFYRCLAERMLSYAIGRSLEFGDEAALETITVDLEKQDGRAQSLIMGVVDSAAFRRMRRPGTDDQRK
jgi:hypothetical protein